MNVTDFIRHNGLMTFLEEYVNTYSYRFFQKSIFNFQAELKVSKSQKQIMASWILPKNERWGIFQYIKLPQRSFFGRIQDNIFFFRDFLTFNKGISTMVNCTQLNFGKRYEDNLWVIFDQWLKLHLGLDVLSNQKILKGIY